MLNVNKKHTTDHPLLLLFVKFQFTVYAINGYHAITLDKESQPLTTFITEWGRYMYLRLPQGFIASGYAYFLCYD